MMVKIFSIFIIASLFLVFWEITKRVHIVLLFLAGTFTSLLFEHHNRGTKPEDSRTPVTGDEENEAYSYREPSEPKQESRAICLDKVSTQSKRERKENKWKTNPNKDTSGYFHQVLCSADCDFTDRSWGVRKFSVGEKCLTPDCWGVITQINWRNGKTGKTYKSEKMKQSTYTPENSGQSKKDALKCFGHQAFCPACRAKKKVV